MEGARVLPISSGTLFPNTRPGPSYCSTPEKKHFSASSILWPSAWVLRHHHFGLSQDLPQYFGCCYEFCLCTCSWVLHSSLGRPSLPLV